MSLDDVLDWGHPEWRLGRFSVPGDLRAGSADLHHQIHTRIDVPMYLQESLRSMGMISTLRGHGRRHVTGTMVCCACEYFGTPRTLAGLSLWRAGRICRLLGWIHVANIGEGARVSAPFASRTTLSLRVVMASIHPSYDDPSGPPPGSPPTCTSLLITAFLSVFLMFH
jgi:hypothetical protein